MGKIHFPCLVDYQGSDSFITQIFGVYSKCDENEPLPHDTVKIAFNLDPSKVINIGQGKLMVITIVL